MPERRKNYRVMHPRQYASWDTRALYRFDDLGDCEKTSYVRDLTTGEWMPVFRRWATVRKTPDGEGEDTATHAPAPYED